MNDSWWEYNINAAKSGNGETGRFLLSTAAARLKYNEPMPDCLRLYLAEVLSAAADSSTSQKQPDAIGRVLNITLPVGTSSSGKKLREAMEASTAVSEQEIAKMVKETGIKKRAARLKLTAKKLGVSEKTIGRRLMIIEDLDTVSVKITIDDDDPVTVTTPD